MKYRHKHSFKCKDCLHGVFHVLSKDGKSSHRTCSGNKKWKTITDDSTCKNWQCPTCFTIQDLKEYKYQHAFGRQLLGKKLRKLRKQKYALAVSVSDGFWAYEPNGFLDALYFLLLLRWAGYDFLIHNLFYDIYFWMDNEFYFKGCQRRVKHIEEEWKNGTRRKSAISDR